MTLERRTSCASRYWYRAKRDGDKVVKRYVGAVSDLIVAFGYRHERLARAKNKATIAESARELRFYEAVDKSIDQYRRQFQQLLKGWLGTRKFQVAADGAWYPIQNQATEDLRMEVQWTQDQFEAIVARAENGDSESRQTLRMAMFDDWATWSAFGDLTTIVKQQYVSVLSRGSIIAEEALRISIAELTRGLTGVNHGPVHKLAIDDVVINFLHLRYQQILAAVPRETDAELERVEKRLNAARRRYEGALETLGKISRLDRNKLEDRIDAAEI